MLRLTERFAASLRFASTVNTTVAVPKAKPFTLFLMEEATKHKVTCVVKFSKWCAIRWNNFTDAKKKEWSEQAKMWNENTVAKFRRLPEATQVELLQEYKATKRLQRMEGKRKDETKRRKLWEFNQFINLLLKQHEAKESRNAMLDAGMLISTAINSGRQGTTSDGQPAQHGDSSNDDDDRDHESTQAKMDEKRRSEGRKE